MSNAICQIIPGASHFRGMDKLENVMCPNCNASLASCHSRGSCLANPPSAPCRNCQTCLMATAPCISSGLVPYFPLPYVCRHWLSVSSNASRSLSPVCTHNHACDVTSSVNGTPSSRRISQIEVTSTNPFTVSGGAVQRLDINATFNDDSRMSSRSSSPEANVIPDIVFSFNGVEVAKIQQPWTADDDQTVLSKTKDDLVTCGWFYGHITWQEAAALLSNTAKGTFLIRNSSSRKCPFALSVQTPQGPTSIRIEYERGKFWLDCERKGITPQFTNIMSLITYYQELASDTERRKMEVKLQHSGAANNVWVDHKGRVFSPISITKPLMKNPLSLKHLCRMSINVIPNGQLLSNELPTSLIHYLSKYPYAL